MSIVYLKDWSTSTVAILLMCIVISAVLLPIVSVHAHHEDGSILPGTSTVGASIDVEAVRRVSIILASVASIGMFVLVVFAFISQKGPQYLKKVIFTLMVILIAVPTLYYVASTIYINIISETKGPVHWHADFEIYACGLKQSSPKPEKFSNKVGTAVLHEHIDRRIHVEGVLIHKEDASLSNFFKVQDGSLTSGSFSVPTGEGVKTISNGDLCPNGTPGVWNVFRYVTEDGKVTQEKLSDYPGYTLSPHELVPPGDCIIFEFEQPKDRTEKICDFYTIELNKGNLIREP